MRFALIASAAMWALQIQAAEFSIVSGDLHAQAMVSGVPPTKDNPADVTLGAGQPSGSVLAHVAVPGPNGTVGSLTTSGGVSLNSASFSFAGHSDGSNGVAGGMIGTGSGSADLIFTLDVPAQVELQGSQSPFVVANIIFTGSATLSSNGTAVAPLTFDGSGQLDSFQNLAAGSYELQATGQVDAGPGAGGNVSESISATIVPEPISFSMFGLIPIGALYLRGKYRLR